MIRPPLVQTNPYAANVFICMSFFVALFNYIRFAREVIWQM
jgi:ethanolaminephosphotransferase